MKKQNKTFNSISTYLTFSLAFYTLLFLGMWQLNKHKIKTYNKSLITSEANEQPKELSSLKEDIRNFQTACADFMNVNAGLENFRNRG